MKNQCALLFGVLSLLFLPCVAMAQLPPVPPCCPWDPRGPVSGGTLFLQAKVVISNQSLQAQGITRDQLLEQLSRIFFTGKKVDLVILSKEIISDPVFSDSTSVLISGEQTLYYRMPRSSITTEHLNSVTQMGLTDGDSWIKIDFQDETVTP